MGRIIKRRYETHSWSRQLLGHQYVSLSNRGAPVPKMLCLEVFCTRLDDGSERHGDDNVDRGDDFCQYNDRRGGAVMIHVVALYCK